MTDYFSLDAGGTVILGEVGHDVAIPGGWSCRELVKKKLWP